METAVPDQRVDLSVFVAFDGRLRVRGVRLRRDDQCERLAMDQRLSTTPFFLLGASLLFAILGGAWRKNEHKPRASLSALGGLVSVVVGALGFSSNAITAEVATWIGIVGLTVTMVLLPLGWKSDAQVAEQARVISELRSQIAQQESELESRRRVVSSLQIQIGHHGLNHHRATSAGLVLAFVVTIVGFTGRLVEDALRGARN
jgi:hypothetical protein